MTPQFNVTDALEGANAEARSHIRFLLPPDLWSCKVTACRIILRGGIVRSEKQHEVK